MKNKDQILLESLYTKIVNENLPKIRNDGYADGGEPYEDDELEAMNGKEQPNDPEMQAMSKKGLGEEYPEDHGSDSKKITVDDLIKAGWTFKNPIDPVTGEKSFYKTWHDEKGNIVGGGGDEGSIGMFKLKNNLFTDDELKNSGDMQRRWEDAQRGIDPGNVSF